MARDVVQPAVVSGLHWRAVLTRIQQKLGDWPLFVLFAGPNLVLLAIFTYWPLLYNVYLSLTSWDLIAPVKPFVGLTNYRNLAASAEFRTVLLNTAVFALGTVGGTTILGLALALLLNLRLRGRTLARAIIFAPVLLSGAAISVFWINMLDPRFGLIALPLRWLGLPVPDWLNSPHWAMAAVVLVYIWQNTGFSMVLYLAGLQNIPHELYEAARIDGASAVASFRHVTLPQLGPTTLFVLVVSVINSFQAFDLIKVLTDGGPVNATTTLLFYIYQQGFVAFNAGRAAAASIVLFVLLLGLSLLQLRLGERRVHYGG